MTAPIFARPLKVGVLIAAVATTSACYSYTPIALDPSPVGERLRLTVTRAGATELLDVLDSNELNPIVQGRLEGREGSTLLVRVPVRTDEQSTPSVVEIGQVIRVPTGEILIVERQDFSRARTALLIGGAAAASALIVTKILDSGRGDPDTEIPDPDIFFTLLSIPFR